MRRIVVLLLALFAFAVLPAAAQSDYYRKKAEEYTREAEYYQKKADGYRRYIGRSMAYSLKRHPVIGIWCHANAFAEMVGLHGLFTGMIISEMQEAIAYGVNTTAEELARENAHLAESLQVVIAEGGPFLQMRNRLVDLLGKPWTELTRFNYKSIYIR